MDFYGGSADGGNCVPQRHASVRVSGSVQDDHVKLSRRFLNPGYQFAFQIGLLEFDLNPPLCSPLPHSRFYVRQSRPAVNLRLALAQQVQVWPVEE